MSDKVESGEKTSDTKHEPATAATEKKATESKPSTAKAAEKAAPAKSSKSNIWVPLLIIAVFAGFIWLVVTGKIDLGVSISKPKMIPLESATTAPPTPSAPPAAETEKTAPITAPAPKAEVPALNNTRTSLPTSRLPARKFASSEEVQQMLDAISGLSNELQQLRSDQAAMQTALMQEQRINLDARLRWIADSASHLPQIQLAWEEISVLPGLSADQRRQAETMLELAQKDSLLVRQWQMNLEKWANTLTTPSHANIIPKPERPWLAWIANQFSLSRAPSVEEEKLDNMRLALLDAAKRIGLESWPNRQKWQTLRARLLLQMQQMQMAETSTTPELGLPENFDTIAKDIETLRETARQWLGENS